MLETAGSRERELVCENAPKRSEFSGSVACCESGERRVVMFSGVNFGLKVGGIYCTEGFPWNFVLAWRACLLGRINSLLLAVGVGGCLVDERVKAV